MFSSYTGVFFFACLGLLSLTGAANITNGTDAIPGSLSLKTAPFVKIGNGYYYIETKLEKSWHDAYESCRRIGAGLVSFETMQEWDLVNQYLFQMKIYYRYWTSGNDLANGGKHIWHSTGELLRLNIWYPGEPDNYKGREHCDEIGARRNTNNNALNDLECSRNIRYICEAP